MKRGWMDNVRGKYPAFTAHVLRRISEHAKTLETPQNAC